jgi:hypothetical protein
MLSPESHGDCVDSATLMLDTDTVPFEGVSSPAINKPNRLLPTPVGPVHTTTESRLIVKLTPFEVVSIVSGVDHPRFLRSIANPVFFVGLIRLRVSRKCGSLTKSCTLWKLAREAIALGTIVMIMFAGCVTIIRIASVV